MPWSGETFVRTDGTRSGPQVWQDARTAGVKIVADGHDTHDEDMASAGITDCVRKSGLNTPTADLPMGSFKHTNVADAVSRDQYSSVKQIQDAGLLYASAVGGTANAVTIALPIAPTNYVDGQKFSWIAVATNTDVVTINVNGLGVKDLEKSQVPLVADDLTDGDSIVIMFDATRDAFQLLSHQRTPVLTVTKVPYSPGTLTGLTLSNNALDATNDIDIAVGKARDTADTANLTLSAAVGKQLDVSWASGGTPGAVTGGLSSSLTLTNDTTYHCFLGKVSDTEEVVFDTDVTGANAVTDHSFTNLRRIGSVRRGTATNIAFTQLGDEFLLDVPIRDEDTSNPGTSEHLPVLSVPIGIKVGALISFQSLSAAPSIEIEYLVTSPDQANTVASLENATVRNENTSVAVQNGIYGEFRTNTSGQIRYRANASNAGVDVQIVTRGWIDRRGRDG